MPYNPATTNLSDKDLSQHRDKAVYRGMNLAQHRLMRSNLSGMDLTGTIFEEADCTDTIFAGAILDKADFRGAVVTLEQINAARSHVDTILPDGYTFETAEQAKAAYAKGQMEIEELRRRAEHALLLEEQLKEVRAQLAAKEQAPEPPKARR